MAYGLPLVHAVFAALIDHALRVAKDEVLGPEADRLEQFEAGNSGGTRSVANEFGGCDLTACQVECVEQTGGGDNGSTVLIVMKDRNVHQLAQTLFDHEAFRCLDVFEIDPAPAFAQKFHAIDDLVGILRGNL